MNDQHFATVPWVARVLAVARQRGYGAVDVAEEMNAPDRVRRIIRSAAGAGDLSDPAWASSLADARLGGAAFLQQLGGRSAFASALDQSLLSRAPFNHPIGAATSGTVANEVAEGQPSPVGSMSLNSRTLVPRRIDATVVLSLLVLEDQSPASQAFVSRQLRKAVARALDAMLGAALIDTATPTYTAGSTTAAILAATKSALDDVNGGSGRCFWIAAPDSANSLAHLNDARGAPSPEGQSEFLGLPFLVSPGLTAGTMLLIDGDRVAANVEGFGIAVARHTSLHMDDAPNGEPNTTTPTASNDLVSLWQTNAAAIRLSALADIAVGAPGAVALVTAIGGPEVVE